MQQHDKNIINPVKRLTPSRKEDLILKTWSMSPEERKPFLEEYGIGEETFLNYKQSYIDNGKSSLYIRNSNIRSETLSIADKDKRMKVIEVLSKNRYGTVENKGIEQ